MKLLTTNNTKTLKGMFKGYSTAILHLAPSNLSGRNVCPWASEECIKKCLNLSGMGVFDNVQQARINRTNYYFENPEAFRVQLAQEIANFSKNAVKKGYIPTVRLNGTSDIPKLAIEFAKKYPNLMFLYTEGQTICTQAI